MPTSWVQVANGALIKIGAKPIMAFTDDSKGARLTSARYENARDCVLRLHIWKCATKRANSAALADPVPDFGYSFYHQLPSDCLRVIGIGPDGVDYRVEGRMIATDSDTLEIRYVKRITDVTELDSLCADAISTYLAWDLSKIYEQSAEAKAELWKEFQTILPVAKSTDGKENPASQLEADDWSDAHDFSGGIDRSNTP